jgi:hypothetical protein
VYHNNENPSDTAGLARPFFAWIARRLELLLAEAVGAILAERERWALWLPAGGLWLCLWRTALAGVGRRWNCRRGDDHRHGAAAGHFDQ